jgi:hypothetical protein
MFSISYKDVTVVVQGAIHNEYTPKCLKSIKEHLPESKIILSTWRDSDVSVVKSLCDEVVLSEDPGGIVWIKRDDPRRNTIFSNINRQIISTQAGLARVDTKYSLKFRTDLELVHTGFVDYFNKYQDYDDRYKCVSERVLLWNLYSRNPHLKFSYPYHFSDIVLFGLTQDLRDIWDIPTMPEGDLVRCRKTMCNRYMPEQYIWLSYLRKYKKIECNQYDSSDKRIFVESKNYMLNNVVLLSSDRFGFAVYKKELLRHNRWSCFTHADWLALYHYQTSGEISLDYIRLKIKEAMPTRFHHSVFRLFIRAMTCLLPNKKLRCKFRTLYNW